MKIRIHSKHFRITRELSEYIQRRAGFAFGQYRDSIRSIIFTLSDVNGPKGGNDKQCKIALQVKGSGEIIIDQKRPDLIAAIHIATLRASNTASRKIERLRNKVRKVRSKRLNDLHPATEDLALDH